MLSHKCPLLWRTNSDQKNTSNEQRCSIIYSIVKRYPIGLEADNDDNPPTKPKGKKVAKLILLLFVILIYTVAVAFASIKLYQKSVADDERDRLQRINPPALIRDGLVNLLDTKTITREISYRDTVDKSMLVTWKISSDFSNPRDPKSYGTLTLDYIADRDARTQKLEFVTLKPASGYNDLYFRMVAGNELTNASKDWYKLSSSNIYTPQPRPMHQRDPQVNLFGLNHKAIGFEKFKGFDFFLYNDPAFYLVSGDMREGPEKEKIISEINNDKAYVLQNCDHDLVRSWCGGVLDAGGMASISPNYSNLEGLGAAVGLKVAPTPFWITANNQSKTIEKLEAGSKDKDKVTIIYSKPNQPVSVMIPEVFIE